LKITYAKITNQGDRDYNEDYVKYSESKDRHCIIVADGLGGHGKGEVASELVATVADSLWMSGQVSSIDRLFDEAQAKLLEKQIEEKAELSMKTTMNIVAMDGKKIHWGHVGDTRTYFFSRSKLKSRTIDHSVPQMLVNIGEIKEEEIRKHPDRNRLLKVMGVEWDKPQYLIEKSLRAHRHQAFLLCTDGFWEYIEEADMTECLKNAKTVEEWLSLMTEIVKKNGVGSNMDNYSAIAVWIN